MGGPWTSSYRDVRVGSAGNPGEGLRRQNAGGAEEEASRPHLLDSGRHRALSRAEPLLSFCSGPPAADSGRAAAPCVIGGDELARRLRQTLPSDGLCLVALSGYPVDTRARDSGFDHHLLKPASVESVVALLNSLEGDRPAPE